uniref:DNA ligase n=1 Tax=Kalanchoe fedtschenkoi TaxID=63787 RepID=A0A7N0RCX2_KALFE
MLGRATAFDALMSAVRVAAQCKTKPSSPPAKKWKETKRFASRHAAKSTGEKAVVNSVVGRENPKSGDGGISPTFSETKPRDEAESASDCIRAVTEEPPAGARALAVEKEPAAKRVRALCGGGRAELKRKIGNLKNRPGDFDPRSVACWEEEEKVPFLFLALPFDLISNESGRIVITHILCNMLRTILRTTPDDLVAAVYLSANRVAAAHEGVELGIGDESIIKVLAEAYGGNQAQIEKQHEEKGDLGLVAKGSRSSQRVMYKPLPLTIDKESGKDSQEKKKNHIKSLLVAATDCEPQYLICLLQAKMRIGYAEQTLLAALGQAAVYTENHSKPPPHINAPIEEAAKIVKQVYSVLLVYEKVITSILTDGLWNLTMTCGITIGIPVGPMLAKPTRGVSEIIENFQGRVYTCEYKYDGQRAQIHYMEDGSIEIYSRNAERNTARFPDVAVTVTRKLENISRVDPCRKSSVNSFILDCEIVAYDRVKNRILPFQTLSTRARKDVTLTDIEVDVCIYAFDMLYCNGQSLIKEQLELRRQLLYDSFEQESGYFHCEGLIVKTLNSDATYEPSKRSNNLLKLKKDYIDKAWDSLDLVPIGAFYGRGKRSGVYGGFLIACYDPDSEEFQSICKISTGFSDALLKECFACLGSKVIPKPKSYYRYGLTVPDVWLKAAEVWEVKCDDLTISAANTAAIGIVDPQKGISLRFPRLLRVRADKCPEQATSSSQVADMFNAQKQNHPSDQAGGGEDEMQATAKGLGKQQCGRPGA